MKNKEKIIQQYKDGASTIDLGKIYDVSCVTIWHWLKKWNITLRTRGEILKDFRYKKGHKSLKSWQKGHIPWNKGLHTGIKPWLGKKRPDIALKMKGRIFSSETLKKKSIAQTGKTGSLCPNWKGGITPINHLERGKFQFYIQKQVLKRDNFTCQICGIKGGRLNVDHIQKWSEYVEGRFCIDNCRTLCVKCHYKITFGKPMSKESKWGLYKSYKLSGTYSTTF
jgi:hypothetical protein